MYMRPPTDEELAAVGMKRSDYDQDAEEVIFDDGMMNSWDVFASMLTQWRTNGSSVYGLDYNVLPILFRVYKIDDEEMCFNDVRILEQAALAIMNKKT